MVDELVVDEVGLDELTVDEVNSGRCGCRRGASLPVKRPVNVDNMNFFTHFDVIF